MLILKVSYYESTNKKLRHNIIRPFRFSGLSYQDVRTLGFPVSRHSFFIKGGRSKIPQFIQDELFNFLSENSLAASNRVIKDPVFGINRQTTVGNQNIIDENIVGNLSQHSEYKPARYLNDNNSELYKKYSSACDYRISKSTFENYLKGSKIFKKPHRDTDLCE